jgi:hypothetical protein
MPRMPDGFKVEIDKDGWRIDRSLLGGTISLPSRLDLRCPAYALLALDRADRRDVYLAQEDFGARAGCAWREIDEAHTDLPTASIIVLTAVVYDARIIEAAGRR